MKRKEFEALPDKTPVSFESFGRVHTGVLHVVHDGLRVIEWAVGQTSVYRSVKGRLVDSHSEPWGSRLKDLKVVNLD